MSGWVFVNGEMVERESARVSAFDRSFLYGDGLFETVRAYGGAPFLLGEHLDRMSGSAEALGIGMPDRGGISAAIAQLIKRNGLADAYVRITLSRGTHTGALAPGEPLEPTLVIDVRPLHAYPAELYERGAALAVSSLRHDSASPLRRHKTTGYVLSILAKREAKERGADEALLLDGDGQVCEGATSNVFCVRGGTLLTPPLDLNILPGVTRATAIRLAGDHGMPIEDAGFTLDELCAADEVFLTNSLMEILPVRRVDESELRPAPGLATRSLAAGYRRLTG